MREITQAPTRDFQGQVTQNAPLRVYDTSGPYTDPAAKIDIRAGLQPLRARLDRAARATPKPTRAARCSRATTATSPPATPSSPASARRKGALEPFPGLKRASAPGGRTAATSRQMHYAKRGIITPEMEYIAMRETLGRAELAARKNARGLDLAPPASRPVLRRADQHAHSSSRRNSSARKSPRAAPSSRPT